MGIELVVPEVGESITEVTIAKWLRGEGELVQKDDAVVELETDKATLELPAPVTGLVVKQHKKSGETAIVGEVIGVLEEKTLQKGDGKAKKGTSKQAKVAEPSADTAQPAQTVPSSAQVQSTQVSQPRTDLREEIVPMTPIRRRIAERLVQSQHSAALLTTFNEVDMTEVMALRAQYREAFEKKYGVRLGIMSFFVKASIEALKLFPQLNAEIRGTDIVYKNYFDIGIAVSSAKGLVVPVIRDADRLSFAETEKIIEDFSQRAQENRIELEELEGGTFTISNGGVFGSLMSTPIVNPPQVGVLGMHAIQDRPVALEGQVIIRPMMYVALTYDHRIVDGREAVTFLRRIKECVEAPSRILLEV